MGEANLFGNHITSSVKSLQYLHEMHKVYILNIYTFVHVCIYTYILYINLHTVHKHKKITNRPGWMLKRYEKTNCYIICLLETGVLHCQLYQILNPNFHSPTLPIP